MNAKGKLITAALTGAVALGALAAPAHAAGIVMLPASTNTFKIVSALSRSKPGEYTADANLRVVNWGPLETIKCEMWTNARESGGLSGWHKVSTDQVTIGVGSQDFDADIQLDAVIDSTRRFKVFVQCEHLGAPGNRPYVEPNAFTLVFTNP
jgi:hypothetical protein